MVKKIEIIEEKIMGCVFFSYLLDEDGEKIQRKFMNSNNNSLNDLIGHIYKDYFPCKVSFQLEAGDSYASIVEVYNYKREEIAKEEKVLMLKKIKNFASIEEIEEAIKIVDKWVKEIFPPESFEFSTRKKTLYLERE